MLLIKSPTCWVKAVRSALCHSLPRSRTMASQANKHNINYNTKHLKKGDPLPPYHGKLRLYNMRYCPYAQRTALALNAKGLDYEVVNVDLVEKPEWLTTKSPFGKVPALEIADGESIYESLVTVEYLDDVYPQRPLLPKDPVLKAMDKIIVEGSAPLHSLMFRILRAPETVTDEIVSAYHKALDFIQDHLSRRGGKFLSGERPGYADYMVWPWFERLLPLAKIDDRTRIDSAKYGVLVKYLENMKKDPIVSDYLIPDEILLKFFESYKAGTPNYDFMTQN